MVGGMRAVIWTDVIQFFAMMAGMLVYIIAGVIQLGGLGNVISIADKGQRLQFFNMNPSLYERHNFYNTVIFGLFYQGALFTNSQIHVQRISSVKSLSDAKMVLIYTMISYFILQVLLFFGGVVVYASFEGCDPLLDGKINNYNQLLSFFILNKITIPGLPGIYSVTLLSSTLSTFSSTLNAAVAMLWKGVTINFNYFSEETPYKSLIINKILIIIYGAGFIGMAFLTKKAKSIIQFALALGGVSLGPLFGLYILGMCIPFSNAKGALIGLISSFSTLVWIYTGSSLYEKSPKILPLSTDFCSNFLNGNDIYSQVYPFNSSLNTPLLLESYDNEEFEEFESSSLMYLYKISYTLYPAIGALLVVIIGSIFSHFTNDKNASKVPPALIFRWSRIFHKKKLVSDFSLQIEEN